MCMCGPFKGFSPNKLVSTIDDTNDWPPKILCSGDIFMHLFENSKWGPNNKWIGAATPWHPGPHWLICVSSPKVAPKAFLGNCRAQRNKGKTIALKDHKN